ncbi:tetratricopeptide repeat protein [Nocardiopsis sp. CNT312]|uniref:tetratricopeptide repeat protein n=1 Tax=Nocardiopsis sp. CNT312 TaxID=1137268 RepID=UPI00048D0C6E|nr:tetratricopeptide repeat protein [Nocardiopsis sp. CNT312]
MSLWRGFLSETGLTKAPGHRADTTVSAPAEENGQEAEEHVEVRVLDPVPPAPVPAAVPVAPGPGPGFGGVPPAARAARTTGTHVTALERTLRALVERHGTEHPDTIAARNNLATKYARMGRREMAVQQFELALAEVAAVYGEEHPRTEIIRENLAWALEDAGRPADAAVHWEILLREREDQFGPADEDTVEARAHLAMCYKRSGRLEEAIGHFEQAIESAASPQRRDELRLSLSLALIRSEHHAAAVEQLRTVLASRRRRLGKSHIDTLTVHHRLGRAYTQAHRHEEAVQVLRDAYRTALGASGDPDVRRLTMRLKRDLAGAHAAADRDRG